MEMLATVPNQKLEAIIEVSTKEKCERLVRNKILPNEKALLDGSAITEEEYKIGVNQYTKVLQHLETSSKEEVEELYYWVLTGYADWLKDIKAVGNEINEELYCYIIGELSHISEQSN